MRKLEKLGTWSRTFLLLSVLCFFAICAQAQTVSGVVKDQNGDAVIGATVKIVGSKSGTVTDSKGHYSIEASNGSILSVSYVGYLTKQMRLRGENVVDIVLMEDNTTLNDLVVVGYGVQKKSDLTGSVASIKSEEIKNLSVTDAGAALQGKHLVSRLLMVVLLVRVQPSVFVVTLQTLRMALALSSSLMVIRWITSSISTHHSSSLWKS